MLIPLPINVPIILIAITIGLIIFSSTFVYVRIIANINSKINVINKLITLPFIIRIQFLLKLLLKRVF